MLTVVLHPGTITIPRTDEESEVLSRDHPPASSSSSSTSHPRPNNRVAHSYLFIQGGWILSLSPNQAAKLDSPLLLLFFFFFVCLFLFPLDCKFHLYLKMATVWLTLWKDSAFKWLDLIFPLNWCLWILALKTCTSKELLAFLTFKLANSFLSLPRRRLNLKCT